MSNIDIIDLYYTLGSKALVEISEMYKNGDISENEMLINQNRATTVGIDISSRDMVKVSIPEYRYRYFDSEGEFIKSGTLSYNELLKGIKLGIIFKKPILQRYRTMQMYIINKNEVYTDKYKFDVSAVAKELDLKSTEDLYELLESVGFDDIDLLRKYINRDESIDFNEDKLNTLTYIVDLLSKIYSREEFVDLYEEEYQYRTTLRVCAYEALRINNLIKMKGL